MCKGKYFVKTYVFFFTKASADDSELPHDSVQAVLHRALAEEFEFTVIHNSSENVLSDNISQEEMNDLAKILADREKDKETNVQKDSNQSGNSIK